MFAEPTGDLYDDTPDPPHLEVDVGGPQILGYLLGPKGEPIATLFDRTVVPFGFR